MEKLQLKTSNLADDNIARIGSLFPECLTEKTDENGNTVKAIDFTVLKDCLSKTPVVDDDDSRYSIVWSGKRAARQLAYQSTTKTLRPCREESVNFETTKNLYIEGDNLDVLKILRETYLGKVKMIYIDPPYNRREKGDLIYIDDYSKPTAEYISSTNQIDENGNRMFENNETNGRYHTDWLNMIYPRLIVARDFLRDDGAIIISIDDNEQANIEKLCNEVFGESNKIAEFVVIRSEGGGLAKQVIKGHDYLFVYARNINKFTPLGKKKDIRGKIIKRDGEIYWVQEDWLRKEFGKYGNCHYEEILEYKGQDKLDEINAGLEKGDYILIPKSNNMHIVGKLRNLKSDSSKFYSILKHLSSEGSNDLANLGLNDVFDYPKPVSLLSEMISGMTLFTGNDEEIIMDFFSGSATTAHAIMKLNAEENGNRKYILVQYPEDLDESLKVVTGDAKKTIENAIKFLDVNNKPHYLTEIGKERIRRAGTKINAEKSLSDINVDFGFRVLKVDSSNVKDVFYTPEETSQYDIDGYIDNIKADRSSFDLLIQVMLEFGIPLDVSIETELINGVTVYHVAGNSLSACFDKGVDEAVIKEMAKTQPLYAAFRDAAYSHDQTKINVEQIFKQLSHDTKIYAV